jgi:hypothetical protein
MNDALGPEVAFSAGREAALLVHCPPCFFLPGDVEYTTRGVRISGLRSMVQGCALDAAR